VCLPWQQWTETSVWFDDVVISEFHSCVVVVDLNGVYYYLSVFWCAVANKSRILHHDNAPAHTALSVWELLASKQITVLEHPPYSPGIAPSNFFLFQKIKEILEGRHFDNNNIIRSNTTAALKVILQIQFQNCFEGWTRLPKGSTLKTTTVLFSN
jgi:hypothetical protein